VEFTVLFRVYLVIPGPKHDQRRHNLSKQPYGRKV